MSYERACTQWNHQHQQYEAETYVENGLTYLMLRCTGCDRPKGARLVRKAVKS